MNAQVKHEYKGPFGHYQYLNDGSLALVRDEAKQVVSKTDMQEIASEYRGVNRIYKPMALLFWTDCKNGNAKDWINQ